MATTTTATTAVITERLSRRNRAHLAIVTAHSRRRGSDSGEMSRWLGGYLVSLASGPMSDYDIAETVRGLAAGWAQIQSTAEADAEAQPAAATGHTAATR